MILTCPTLSITDHQSKHFLVFLVGGGGIRRLKFVFVHILSDQKLRTPKPWLVFCVAAPALICLFVMIYFLIFISVNPVCSTFVSSVTPVFGGENAL